jgi:ribonuclease D
VLHLHELRDRLVAELAELGRLEWVADECEAVRVRPRGPRDPDEAWLRIKEARHLRGAARGAARSLAAWREQRAAELDQPVRAVLADLALVGIAQRRPRTLDQLRDVRGIDGRHVRGDLGEQILAAVRVGEDAPPPPRPDTEGPTMSPKLRPAVSLVATWAAQRARDLRLDPSILATRTDIEVLLRGDTTGRLSKGWRAEVLGNQVQALVNGDAALAFDTDGHLVLEERSRRPLT